MAKYALAVYDPCRLYIERLLEYAGNQNHPAFELRGFTDLSVLYAYLQNNKIKAVLFSRETENNRITNAETEILTGMEKMRDLKIIFLGEQPLTAPEPQQIPWINKYQPADRLLEEVYACLFPAGSAAAGQADKGNLRLAGLYCPWDKCSHPDAAAVLVRTLQECEEKTCGRVLYINLEQFSGMQARMDRKWDASISDIIFYYRTNREKVAEIIHQTIGSFREMDVLTAPRNWTDMEEIGKEEWPDFFAELSVAGDYQYILIDMPVFMSEIMDVISEYGNLYVPALPYSSGYEKRGILTRPGPWQEQELRRFEARMQEFRDAFLSGELAGKQQYVREVHFDFDRGTETETDQPD